MEIISVMIVASLFGMCSIVMLMLIQRCHIKMKRIRKAIILIYRSLHYASNFLLIMGIILCFLYMYWFLFEMTEMLVFIITKNLDVSKYIALSFILLFIEPFMLIVFKYARIKLLKKYEAHKEFKGLIVEFISRIIIIINNIPVKGVIHLTNIILVLIANISKILEVETNLTASLIYMSVATYYALDKFVEYFIKNYPSLCEKIDNKLFKTEEIEKEIKKEVKIDLKELKRINKKMFENYIEIGKFELKNN